MPTFWRLKVMEGCLEWALCELRNIMFLFCAGPKIKHLHSELWMMPIWWQGFHEHLMVATQDGTYSFSQEFVKCVVTKGLLLKDWILKQSSSCWNTFFWLLCLFHIHICWHILAILYVIPVSSKYTVYFSVFSAFSSVVCICLSTCSFCCHVLWSVNSCCSHF